MSDSKKGASPVKGNDTTELVIGKAALKMSAAVKALQDSLSQVQDLDQVIEDKTLEVTNLEAKLENLATQLKNGVEQNKITLKLSYESDKERFAREYLGATNQVSIKVGELNELRDNLVDLEVNVEGKIAEAVSSATSALHAKHNSELKVMSLEYEKKEAENKAFIGQLQNKVTFLEEQVESWKSALDAERAAGVERAKAGSIGTINVGTDKR